MVDRRAFLTFVAGDPLLAAFPAMAAACSRVAWSRLRTPSTSSTSKRRRRSRCLQIRRRRHHRLKPWRPRHGTGRGTIECVAEVAAAVRGRVPVLVDGGFRRGTDVFKALALGANAVGICRPYIWGLAAHGQQGGERVLDILNNELRLAMIGCGTIAVKDLTTAALIDRRR